MNVILASAKWQYALAYFDDIIVFAKKLEEHIRHYEEVL